MKWQALTPAAIKNLDKDTFVLVARPDGKSWSGIIVAKNPHEFTLRNGNILTSLSYQRNPTACFTLIPVPRWTLEFGQARLL